METVNWENLEGRCSWYDWRWLLAEPTCSFIWHHEQNCICLSPHSQQNLYFVRQENRLWGRL